jgi:hypothetical protein
VGSSSVRPPIRKRIYAVTGAVDIVLDRCEKTMRHTGMTVLCWLRTNRPSPYHLKLFKFLTHENSQKDYRRYLKRLVCFILHSHRIDTSKCKNLTGIQFTKQQTKYLLQIWGHEVWSYELSLDAMDSSTNNKDQELREEEVEEELYEEEREENEENDTEDDDDNDEDDYENEESSSGNEDIPEHS